VTGLPQALAVTRDRATSSSTNPVVSQGSKWPALLHGARPTVVCCSTAAIPSAPGHHASRSRSSPVEPVDLDRTCSADSFPAWRRGVLPLQRGIGLLLPS